jgi:hypothetical protein
VLLVALVTHINPTNLVVQLRLESTSASSIISFPARGSKRLRNGLEQQDCDVLIDVMSSERVEVSLGNGETKVFESFHELNLWKEQERQFWNQLSSGAQWPQGRGSPPWSKYHEFYGAVDTQLNEATRFKQDAQLRKTDPQIEGVRNSISSFFKRYFDDEGLLHSQSAAAQFIAETAKKEGSTTATFALAYLTRHPIQMDQHSLRNFDLNPAVRAAALATLFEQGIAERTQYEQAALHALHVEWTQKFQSFRLHLEREVITHKQLNAQAEGLLKTQSESLANINEQQRKKNEDLLKQTVAELKRVEGEHDKRYKELQAFLNEEMALQSPVRYWTDKAKGHLKMAWLFGLLSLGCAAVVGILLTFEIKTLLAVPAGVAQPENWHPPYWRFGVLIVIGLLALWFTRIIVRLFLSNVHLLSDARERVTMVRTYLALLRRGKALGNEDRQLILQAMFRPATSGMIKDDAVPVSALEAWTKGFSRP